MAARRGLRVDAVLVQAVIAGALSFAHLHDLAAAAGQGGWKAWAYPVSVDLLMVAAWRRLRRAGPSRLAWCWFVIALFASLGANIATAGFLDLAAPPAALRLGVAGWPALAFLGGTLLAHTAGDGPRSAPPEATRSPETGALAVPEPVPVAHPGASRDVAPPRDDTPLRPTATAPGPARVPTPPIPAVLIDHARKVAEEHRARTGSPIGTDALRARLGVPPHLAEAIAARLN